MAATGDAPPRRRIHQPFCPAGRRRYVLMAAILASAMGFIDGTVVAIAVPAIRESLGAGLGEMQWVNTAYMLPLSALILVGGALGDGYGVRRVFAAGIAAFAAASVACALAPTPGALIAARAVQGVAAAAMVPSSLAILSKAYPRDGRGRAIGIWAAASALTTAGGPILGGAVLSAGGAELWRMIFAINLPVGAAALAMLWLRVPPDAPVDRPRIDWPGAALAAAGLGLLAWALTGPGGEGGRPGTAHLLGWGAAALAVLGGFLAVEARAAHPMMPLRLFRSRAFAAANALTFCLYFALSGILFFLPMTLIAGFGVSETQAGLIFLPLSGAIALGSGAAGRLADRVGPGPPIAGGAALVAVAHAGLAVGIGAGAFRAHVLPMMVLMGAGMALVVAPLSAAVMGAVADADAGAASGINNAISRMAGLVAVAALGGVAAGAFALAGGTGGFGAAGADPGATAAGLAAVAWVTAALAALAAVIARAFLPRAAAGAADAP